MPTSGESEEVNEQERVLELKREKRGRKTAVTKMHHNLERLNASGEVDFLKSPLSYLFSTRRTKDFSYSIDANFSDPKTGRCALTNQRSP